MHVVKDVECPTRTWNLARISRLADNTDAHVAKVTVSCHDLRTVEVSRALLGVAGQKASPNTTESFESRPEPWSVTRTLLLATERSGKASNWATYEPTLGAPGTDSCSPYNSVSAKNAQDTGVTESDRGAAQTDSVSNRL